MYNHRLWLAVTVAVVVLIAFLVYRAYQLGPLLFPPAEATEDYQLDGLPADWPSGRHDLRATGSTSAPPPSVPLSARWEYEATGGILATPAVVGGRVYITTESGMAAALDASTGQELWTYETGSPSDSSPAVTESTVYFGSRDHRVLALDRDTGAPLWEHNLGNIVLGSPVVADGTLYIGSTNGAVEALDASTGERRWSANANGWLVSHVATDGEVVAATSLGERFITADPDTGRRRLNFFTGTPVAGGPIIADGRAYFVTNRGGVWAVDPQAVSRPFSRFAYVAKVNFFAWRLRDDPPRQVGSIWVGSARGRVKHSPVYANGNLMVVNEAGRITAFNAASGEVIWDRELEVEVVAEPVAAGEALLIATNDRRLLAFDTSTGATVWEHDLVNVNLSAAPAIADGTLYLPTSDGRLLAMRSQAP